MSINYIHHYDNWHTPSWMIETRQVEIRSRVFDLIAELDSVEHMVYKDRDYPLANKMLLDIGVKIP